MGLDATLARIKFKVNSDLDYEKIRKKKYAEFKKNNEKFYAWEDTIWEEVLYTSNWAVAHSLRSRNIGSKAVDFGENRDVVLSKEDIEIIIDSMEKTMEIESNLKMKESYNIHLTELRDCLNTTDFEKETLLYGEWD